MTVALNAEVSGEGPPLVILHGLFGAAQNWNTVGGRLASDWTVHAPDMRNHGASPWADDMSYPEMAADVLAYIEASAGGRAAVIGHSMGGKAAMAAALTAPDAVSALVVADIAPVAYDGSLIGYVKAMQAADLSAVDRRSDADAKLAAAVPEKMIRAFLLQNLVREGDGYRWRINLDALAAGMETLNGFPETWPNASYNGPTLFLGGGASDYIRPAHRETIQGLFPSATFETLEGAGHWVHAEAPDAFTEAVRTFLAGA